MKVSRKWVVRTAEVIILLAGVGFCNWFVRDQLRKSNLEQVKKDFQDLNFAICSYGVDFCGVFMPPDSSRKNKDRHVQPTFETDREFLKAYCENELPYIHDWFALTTPIGYIKAIPGDPFRDLKPYGFLSWNHFDDNPTMGIIHSPGPDKDDDIDLWDLKSSLENRFQEKSYYIDPDEVRVAFRDYLFPHLYDPTNGVASSGDLVQVNMVNGAEIFGSFRLTDDWLNARIKTPEEIRAWESQSRGYPYQDGHSIANASVPKVQAQRDEKIQLPQPLVEAFGEFGLSFGDDDNQDNSLFWQAGAGRLGRDFLPTIKSADRWDETQNDLLVQWMKEEQVYWSLIAWLVRNQESYQVVADDTPKDTVGVKSDAYFIAMPIIGKSLYLFGIKSVSSGELDKARQVSDTLRTMISFLGGEGSRLDPHQHQIQTELLRLSRALDNQLKTNSLPR